MATDPQILPKAVLFCDEVYREPVTKKLTLFGLFSHWNAHTYPESVAQLHVYFEFQSEASSIPFRFTFGAVGEEPFLDVPIEFVREVDARPGSTIVVTVGGFVVPAPSVYRAGFWIGEKLVADNDLPFLQS
jgi:hypothetical protein